MRVVMNVSDKEILQLIKSQKEVGIRKLFDRYYRPLVYYARELIEKESEAEDLVQELFIRIWQDEHLNNFIPSSLSSYLFTSTRNACLNYLKKKDILRDGEELAQSVDIPIEIVSSIDEELLEKINTEINNLSPRTRQVLECVIVKGMKYKDAAAELNISINTVKSTLQDATKRLRENLSISKNTLLLYLILNKGR